MTHLRGEHLDENGEPTAGCAALTALLSIFGMDGEVVSVPSPRDGLSLERSEHSAMLAVNAAVDHETEED
jgi:hypothetical protein